jgi:hypothetical protein
VKWLAKEIGKYEPHHGAQLRTYAEAEHNDLSIARHYLALVEPF